MVGRKEKAKASAPQRDELLSEREGEEERSRTIDSRYIDVKLSGCGGGSRIDRTLRAKGQRISSLRDVDAGWTALVRRWLVD